MPAVAPGSNRDHQAAAATSTRAAAPPQRPAPSPWYSTRPGQRLHRAGRDARRAWRRWPRSIFATSPVKKLATNALRPSPARSISAQPKPFERDLPRRLALGIDDVDAAAAQDVQRAVAGIVHAEEHRRRTRGIRRRERLQVGQLRVVDQVVAQQARPGLRAIDQGRLVRRQRRHRHAEEAAHATVHRGRVFLHAACRRDGTSRRARRRSASCRACAGSWCACARRSRA